jgi:hypothetical protein
MIATKQVYYGLIELTANDLLVIEGALLDFKGKTSLRTTIASINDITEQINNILKEVS